MIVLFKEENIAHAYKEISDCKSELQQAKRIRRNRQGRLSVTDTFEQLKQASNNMHWLFILEYDALAQGIAKHPERQETMRWQLY